MTENDLNGITGYFENKYLNPVPKLKYGSAYQLLVAVVLSAQCTDERVNIVCVPLFRKYPDVYAMAEAKLSEVEEIIRPCGLYHTKAESLIKAAQMIVSDFGGRVPDTMEELLKLPGVGRKVANLILGDLYGTGGTVADTHCIRIAGKLGFYPETCKDPRKTEKVLSELIAPEKQSDFCHRIVLLGRDCCTARSPECDRCPISEYCEHYGRSK